MFKNYLTTAFRNLWRNKGFSLINIAGLTFGISVCMLIGLFVWDEKQYDKFIPDGDRVYRIYNIGTRSEGTSNIATTPPMFVTTLQQEFPEVEHTMRVLQIQSKGLFEKDDKKIYEEKGILAEPAFFEIFPLPPYRIHIDWKIFVIAGSAAILIALLTVSFQVIKAAIANPVKSLRTE